VADVTVIEERCITLLGLHASLAGITWRASAAGSQQWPPSSCPSPRRILGAELQRPHLHHRKGMAAFLIILSVGLNVACVVVTVFILSRRRWN
jgi:magnesium transporter